MKWIHNGIKYKTKKIDWEEYIKEPHDFLFNDIMVYHIKWDRCYYIRRFRYDRGRLMALLDDIYIGNGFHWTNTKYLEMVVKI